MTNAEKYQEVFGLEPEIGCPTLNCNKCPIYEDCYHDNNVCLKKWWYSEYKEKADENS